MHLKRERGAHTCDEKDCDHDGEKDVCNHDAEIFLQIKKITDHFISKNSLGRDIFALLTFLMTTITNRWDIKGYRGISRHIKGNQGISWDMEGYQGTLRDIEGYRGMSRDITIITYVGKLVGYRGISTIQGYL